MPAPLAISVYSDVVCPWCYVGKRRLEAALALPDSPKDVRMSWRPFELNPDLPVEGIERAVYRARKFGAATSAALDAKMAKTGRELGIEFAFERMARTPNTRLAHRLIWEAERQRRQNELVDRLFAGYFEQGLDIGARQVLEGLAVAAGLEPSGVRRALDEPESLAAVIDLEHEGLRLGVAAVPFFILPGPFGVSGAQPPEFWQKALAQISATAAPAAS
jgi:predicted DsbA family dithiol-disulfide isomerase